MNTFFPAIFLYTIFLQTCLCNGNGILLDSNFDIHSRQTNYLYDTSLPVSHTAKFGLSGHHRRKQENVKENIKLYKKGSFFKPEYSRIKSFHPGSAVSDRRTFWKNPINASLAVDRHRIYRPFQAPHAKLKKSILNDLQSRSHLFQDIHVKHRKSPHNVSPMKLFVVAALLARHKYTGYDPRQNDGFGPKNFHRHFPIPPLVALHPVVSKACEKGFSTCIKEIRKYTEPPISQTSSLESRIERFEFLTTASYYMCWYTMRRVTDLLQLDSASPDKFQCLDFNSLRYYRDSLTHVRIIMTRPSGPSIEDVRLSDFKRPYLCAELSFCPDYCYGRNTQGIVKDIRKDKGNPCFGLPDSWCSIDPNKNTDFSNLMRNDVNSSCRCEAVNVGFAWNTKLGLCVDIDECEEGQHNCAENTICQNTVGGFRCVCTWGYHWTGHLCIEVTELQNRSDVDTARRANRESSNPDMLHDWLFSHTSPTSDPNQIYPMKIQNVNIASFAIKILSRITVFCFLYIF